jgi:branched-chain amino acid transport system ATP-binding protein
VSAVTSHEPAGAPAASAPGELKIQSLTAGYYTKQPVLQDLNLSAAAGRVTCILGPNGAGKSTVLRVIAGLLPALEGHVLLDGECIDDVAPHDRITRGVAYLPQGRSAFPLLTVTENLELGAWALRRDRKLLRARVHETLERYAVLRDNRHRPAGSLSGGQQRILEVARMMITDPRLILIDEPSVGLAPVIADTVYEEIARLKREGRTIVLVDQNVRAAVRLSDYVYTLMSGRNHLEGDRAQFAGDLDGLIKRWLRI